MRKNIAMNNNITRATSPNHRAIQSHATASDDSSALSAITVEGRRSPGLSRSIPRANHMSEPSNTQAGDPIQWAQVADANALARNPNTPAATLERLASHAYPRVRMVVASNTNTPTATLETLAKDANVWVKESVASNPNTPTATLEKLAEYLAVCVKSAVASNPNTPTATLERLASNPNTSARVLKMLAEHPKAQVKVYVASNPNTSESTLSILLEEENQSVYSAANEALSRKYSAVPDEEVSGVARYPDTSEAELLELAEDRDVGVRRAVASNPKTPESRFYEDPAEALVRVRVASNPDTTPEELEQLLYDSNFWVCQNARANHPDTTPEELEQLLTEAENAILDKNAEGYSSSKYAEAYDLLKESVASNFNTPRPTLEKLASDPNTPRPTLEKLASDPNTPTPTLERLASNPNTPAATLFKLLYVDNDSVKKAAQLNFKNKIRIVI